MESSIWPILHDDDTQTGLRYLVDVGGRGAEAPHHTRFGSGAETYVFTAADHEGNLWTFGTMPQAPAHRPGGIDNM